MGGEKGMGCEHIQVLLTNLLQKHWGGQGNRKEKPRHGTRCTRPVMDIKTAFAVARTMVVAKVLQDIGCMNI